MEAATAGAKPEQQWEYVTSAEVNSIPDVVAFINDCAKHNKLISYRQGEADDQLRAVIFRDIATAPTTLVNELKDAILDYVCAMDEKELAFGPAGCRGEMITLLFDVHRNWRASDQQSNFRLPAASS